mgnify:CR=1 FL=1
MEKRKFEIDVDMRYRTQTNVYDIPIHVYVVYDQLTNYTTIWLI